MLRILITSVIATAALLLGTPQDAPDVEAPKVIALKFHADWCGTCKAMGPVFDDLANKYDTQPVLFLTLDQTTEVDRRQSRYLAAEIGCESIWREHGGKTGFVLLVDGDSRDVLAKLGKDDDIKAMGAALLTAVERATNSGR